MPDSADEELLARMREIAQCMAAIREARGETAPYSRETLGAADLHDIELARDVLTAAYAAWDGG